MGALGEPQFLRPLNKLSRVYRVRKPWRLRWCDRTDARVLNVACGNGFSLMVVAGDTRYKGDKLYGTGMNTQSQIGVHKVSNNESLKYLIEPGLIHLPFDKPYDVKIRGVACGRTHSIVLTNEGMFSFGNNSYGQCGRSIVENEEYFDNPSVIQKVWLDDDIVDVKCGQDHTCFLSKEGKVYTCGWSADGQLGQDTYTVQSKPSEVKGDIQGVKITHLATKGDFVLALSKDGELFGWGNNEYKQLLMTGIQEPQIGVPRHVKLPQYVKLPILSASCSGTHCIIVDGNGQVWVWGFGLLGRGPKCEESKEPLEIPDRLLGKYQELPHTQNKKVSFVQCGLNCSTIVMDDGSLYMWGKNSYGTIGVGENNDIYFPLRVNIPAQVRLLDCGADQVFAICKSFT